MRKKVEKDCYTIEIETLKKPNGVSCVASVKCFVRPKTASKSNGTAVDNIEKQISEITAQFVKTSDLLSDNHITDFECTRENLNPEKWSRVKADLYLFTPFVDCGNEMVVETEALCEKVGEMMLYMFHFVNNIDVTKSVS